MFSPSGESNIHSFSSMFGLYKLLRKYLVVEAVKCSTQWAHSTDLPRQVGSESTCEKLSWCGCTRLPNRWMLSCLTNETRVCCFSVIEKKLILIVCDFPKLYNCYLSRHQRESVEGSQTKLEENIQSLQDAVDPVGHTDKGIR